MSDNGSYPSCHARNLVAQGVAYDLRMSDPVEMLKPRAEQTFSLLTRDGLRVDATTDPDHAILDMFFQGYDRAFVLPNEKEGLEGFKTCLALNQPPPYPDLCRRYGAFREVVLVAADPPDDGLIGGANFIAFPVKTPAGPILSANLNYVYSDPTRRRRGYLRRLIAAVSEVMSTLFDLPPPTGIGQPALRDRHLIFLEQNDPLRLTPDEYAHDTAHSGIDQVDRIGIWAKLGAHIVDFPYVQPPLSATQEADRTLLYAVMGAQQTSIDPEVLRQQLSRFFAISVLKGRDPTTDPSAAAQFALLEELQSRGARVPLLDPVPWLQSLPAPGTPERLRAAEGSDNLLEVLRQFQVR